jgi:hypothetical protein
MKTSRASDLSRWIISPAFDLAFLANLWWIGLVFLPNPAAASQDGPLVFWQLYFITTPHRWLTLFLVATDPYRRQGRTRLFIGLAIACAVVVLAYWSVYETFRCLLFIDYLWNAWHFGSQHAGILRTYGRKAGGGRPKLELNIIRFFVMYVALRTATGLHGWMELYPVAGQFIGIVDLIAMAAPGLLVGLELSHAPTQRLGKLVYLCSVYFIYSALLIAIRRSAYAWILPLTVGTAAFHAVEYLAFVTYYARRRRDTGSESLFRAMARNWLQVLAIYMIATGIVSSYCVVVDNRYYDIYLGLNIWAAFLHYAYDGMIWKLRRPDTAKVLGLELGQPQTAA